MMKKKIIAVAIIVVGIGVIATPFVRSWFRDQETGQLLEKLDTGAALIVEEQPVSDDDMDSWADADGLHDFEYEDDFGEFGDYLSQTGYFDGEIADSEVEVGADDGFVEDTEEINFGDIALDDLVEAEALDVEGLKRKRLIPIGKIQIPAIGADLPVVDNAGKTELHYAVGHVGNSADFGRTGNCVLAGHRNYTYGSMFNRMGEMRPGDEIILTARDGTRYRYEVFECVDVLPGSKEITNFYREERRMTIVTCTPLGVGSHRLLVRGDLVEIIPPAEM